MYLRVCVTGDQRPFWIMYVVFDKISHGIIMALDHQRTPRRETKVLLAVSLTGRVTSQRTLRVIRVSKPLLVRRRLLGASLWKIAQLWTHIYLLVLRESWKMAIMSKK